mgnify:FL=1
MCSSDLVLTASQGGKFVARALVWSLTYNGENIKVMDRVYACSPELEQLMFEHAKNAGWWRKARQNNTSTASFTLPDGSERSALLSVRPVSRWHDDCSFWPYLDSFRWLDSDDGELRNSESLSHELNQTDGEREERHEGEVQDVNGEWISEDDAVSINGDYYHVDSDEIVTCHRSEEYILRSDAYEVNLSRHETIYIHEDYVNRA